MNEQAKETAPAVATQPQGRAVPGAPKYESLPAAKARATRGGPKIQEISVRVEVVTPILGGSTQTRAVDEVDIIRAATVRGSHYLGSAPTPTAANRGIVVRRVRRGCVMPGESPAVVGDALRQLAGAAAYLCEDGPRYGQPAQRLPGARAGDGLRVCTATPPVRGTLRAWVVGIPRSAPLSLTGAGRTACTARPLRPARAARTTGNDGPPS
jgi:hypothetical protein